MGGGKRDELLARMNESSKTVSFTSEVRVNPLSKFTKPKPSIAPSASMEEYMEHHTKLKEDKYRQENIKLKKILSSYRSSSMLKIPSRPLNIGIPSKFKSKEDILRYATESDEYKQAFDELENNQFYFKEIQETFLALYAYLYAVKTLEPTSEESPLNFYLRCSDNAESKILELKDLADAEGLSLTQYINENIL